YVIENTTPGLRVRHGSSQKRPRTHSARVGDAFADAGKSGGVIGVVIANDINSAIRPNCHALDVIRQPMVCRTIKLGAGRAISRLEVHSEDVSVELEIIMLVVPWIFL